jgi:hypothetical protein
MESERNRPGARDRDPNRREQSAGSALISRFLTDGIAGGWPPERVADAAFAAIREERFYVIPAQDDVKAGLHQRIDELREERNPAMPRFSEPA